MPKCKLPVGLPGNEIEKNDQQQLSEPYPEEIKLLRKGEILTKYNYREIRFKTLNKSKFRDEK